MNITLTKAREKSLQKILFCEKHLQMSTFCEKRLQMSAFREKHLRMDSKLLILKSYL
jgi:hypothetical protein